MKNIDVNGVKITFPFEPYPCQLDYMGKVIECLKKDVNGVLESPTGTGKTLCLLCSSLAWQEGRKAQTEFNRQVSVSSLMGSDVANMPSKGLESLSKSLENSTGTSWGGSQFAVPKIIYASRTHSQLSQVIQELKRTAYNSVKVSVIGSRDQLCIHEQVKKEQNNTNKVHMCRNKVNARTCYYYNHLDDLKKNSEPRVMTGNVVDIEDLVSYGTKNKVCPYYLARELKADADIIFMPYNYLLDPKTRKAHGVELAGNVVIFDEAHNLEKICEDSSSFDLKPGDLATAIEECSRLGEKFLEMMKSEEMTESSEYADAGPEPDFTLDDILRMKGTLTDLEEQIDQINVPDNGKGITKPGIFMFELLTKANIVFGNKNIIIDVMDKMVGYLNQQGAGTGITKGAGLSKVADILKIIFSQELSGGQSLTDHQQKLSRSYKVHMQKEDTGRKKKQMDLWTNNAATEKSGKTLSYWCFSPGHSMSDLITHGIKCIILTSGTLSPIPSFTAEMQIPFPVTLENPHVIEKHQVWIGTLKKGPDGTLLNSNFETRYKPEYQASLGNCIVNFARVVPNGLLIFFPSYPVMEKCLDFWKDNNIWSRIEQYKQIFVESKAKGVLNDLMNDFYSKINDPSLNGAIFVAVCRGKVSEGLDFADINGRAVVITGLPYPPYLDPKVVLKMQYLDEMRGKQGFQSLCGKDWYKQQASRAVNQAIGRVIRHKQDFGAILLCDERFSSYASISQLPIWVRPYVNKYDTFGLAVKDAMIFFKHAEKVLTMSHSDKMPAAMPSKKGVNSKSTSGAYFMPTVTRGSSGPLAVQPSHRVMQHVPSLKHREETMSVDHMREHYAGGRSQMVNMSQKSLFSALDHSEQTLLDRSVTDSQTTAFPSTSNAGDTMRKPVMKKKIMIKKRDSDSSSSKCTEVSSKVSMAHVNTAEQYISEVKSTLSGASYKMFSKALVEYKKTEDIGQVCAVLGDLFIEEAGNHHQFANFYRFVRAKHKQHFHEVCLQLTGLQTAYKPEDSVNRKRLQDEATSNQAKKQKTTEILSISDEKNSKANSKTNAVKDLILQKSSKQETENIPTNCNTTLSNKGSVGKTNGLEGKTKNNMSGEVDGHGTKAQCNGNGETGDVKVAAQPERAIIRETYFKGANSGYTCCLCKSDAKIPFQAQCDHICCMNCWRSVFEGDKLCPKCQRRTRRRQLTRLLFPNGDDEDKNSESS